MARIIGGLGTSHVPSIGAALDKGLRDTADWKPFFDGYEAGKDWMRQAKPDIAVVIFNDHGNTFFLDKVPTFAVGAAMPLAMVLVAPAAWLVWVVSAASLLFLTLLFSGAGPFSLDRIISKLRR